MEDVQNQGGAADGGAAADQSQGTQGGADNQDQGQGNGQNGSQDASKGQNGSQSEADGKDKGGQSDQDDGPKDPQVRKSKLEYILERKRAKAEKANPQQKKSENQPSAQNDDGGEDDLTPEEEKKFSKYMDKHFGDTLKKIDGLAESGAESEVHSDVQAFLSSKEGKYFEKYADKITAWAKHPSRANIPIQTIAMEAAGVKGMLAIGAAMERDAAKEAKESQAGGSSTRSDSQPSQKKVSEMTDAEFMASKAQVLQKRA